MGQYDAAHRLPLQSGLKDQEIGKPAPSITLVKSLATDDSVTQLSSSDGSVKPPSLDGKSVASGTTFALDEKESIRPDDSASLRAVEEEDVVSPPDSIAAGSRVGSDSGVARAFRDQLHEISADWSVASTRSSAWAVPTSECERCPCVVRLNGAFRRRSTDISASRQHGRKCCSNGGDTR